MEKASYLRPEYPIQRTQLSHSDIRSGRFACVYCGGVRPGTTVDHVPPKIIFDGKRRPNDLVVPCCDQCRTAPRDFDAIAGWLSRIYGDPDTPEQEAEVTRLTRDIVNRYPEIARSLNFRDSGVPRPRATDVELPPDAELVSIDGPHLDRAMTLFSARAGLALHWWGTDRVVPPEGHVHGFWFTNFNKIAGEVPDAAFNLFPGFRTLIQGRHEVRDQFEYASGFTEDGTMSIHTLTFRFSFMCLALVSERPNASPRPDKVVQPGRFGERWPFPGFAVASAAEQLQ